MRRPRTLVIATAAGGVVLAVWAGVALWTYAQRPQVTGTPQQWYRTSAPQVLVPVENAGNLTGPARRASTAATLGQAARDRQGPRARGSTTSPTATHGCTSRRIPSRVFGDSVDAAFTIHVDTQQARARAQPRAARLAPDQPRSAAASSPARSWPLSYAGSSVVVHPAEGAFALDPELPDGRTTVRLIASDRAGNRSVITRTVAVDGTPPRLHIDRVPGGRRHGAPDAARLARRRLAGDRAGEARRRLGRAARRPTARRCSASGAVKGRFSLPLRASAQGVHRLSITAIDAAGNTSHRRGRARSRSTRPRSCAPRACSASAPAAPTSCSSSAGSRPSAPTRAPFTRFYNARTEAAVRAFQAKHELPVTGIATPQLLQLSKERIVVHLKRFRVELIRDGKKVFSAPIAIGQPALPDADRPLTRSRPRSRTRPGCRRTRPGPPGSSPSRPASTIRSGRAGSARARPNIGFHATPQESTVGTRPRTAACACTASTSSGSTSSCASARPWTSRYKRR